MPSSEVMHKFKERELHSGSPKGPIVRNRKQAIAIEISEKKNEAKHGGEYVSGNEPSGVRRNPLAGTRRPRS